MELLFNCSLPQHHDALFGSQFGFLARVSRVAFVADMRRKEKDKPIVFLCSIMDVRLDDVGSADWSILALRLVLGGDIYCLFVYMPPTFFVYTRTLYERTWYK